MNTANKLTVLRILLIPAFVVVCYLNFPMHHLVALAIFILASLTDMLDGKIARKYNMVTDFGKFLDPIADKLLVTAAMMMFVAWHWMPAWVLIVVIAREFIVSALRMVAATNGKVIAAGMSGKVKTASTMVCVCIMLLGLPQIVNHICSTVILVTTAYSGIEYMVKNRDVLDWSHM